MADDNVGAVGSQLDSPTAQKDNTFTEKDWNPYTLEQLDEISRTGITNNPFHPAQSLFYMGAKKFAELKAYEICDTARKGGKDITLASMNCVIIAGPPSKYFGLSNAIPNSGR